MKTQFLQFAVLLLALVGSVCACDEKNEPVEIPFTEYSLDGTLLCEWTNLDYDNKVIIINSNEELENYVNCMDGSNYPEVDFSKYTLLLAKGRATSGIADIAKRFIKVAENNYSFNIDITLNMNTVAPLWTAGILISKISLDAIVLLNVVIHH